MKIFKILTALAAFFAVAVLSGCDDDKRPEPDPQPVKLASPEIVFKDVKPTSFAASWTAVEHAAAFGYKLLTTEGGQEVVVAEVASYDAVEVSFRGSSPLRNIRSKSSRWPGTTRDIPIRIRRRLQRRQPTNRSS